MLHFKYVHTYLHMDISYLLIKLFFFFNFAFPIPFEFYFVTKVNIEYVSNQNTGISHIYLLL